MSPEVATIVLERLYAIERFAQLFYLGLAVLILFFATSVAATSQHNGWQAAGNFLRVAGCSFLVASAAATVGCLVGFLFGIPRTPPGLHIVTPPPNQQEKRREQRQPEERQAVNSTQQASKPRQDSQKEQTQPGGQAQHQTERSIKAAPEQADHANSPFLVNTSLEEISDWLTKIIIGLSLVQFHSFLQTLTRIHRIMY